MLELFNRASKGGNGQKSFLPIDSRSKQRGNDTSPLDIILPFNNFIYKYLFKYSYSDLL